MPSTATTLNNRPTNRLSRPGSAVILLISPLLLGATLPAQSDAQDAPALGSLTDRLDSLERDNQQLRAEVNALRAETNQEWLTEERSTQIRSIVTDVLEDSSSRMSLQESGATAGWNSQLGFFLRSSDNRFLLRVSGLVQARYMFSTTGEAGARNETGLGNNNVITGGAQDLPNAQYGFDLPHTRLVFQGHVFEPGIRYYLRTQFSPIQGLSPDTFWVDPVNTGALDVLDAYVSFDLTNEWSLRFGQFKLPFSRERLVSVQNRLAATNSFVDDIMGLDRSQGVELSTRGDDLYWAVAISDGGTDNLLAGISNNSGYFPVGTVPVNTPYWDQQADFAITSRVEFKIAGTWDEYREMTSPPGEAEGLMVGLAGHYQIGSRPTTDGYRIPGGGQNPTLFNSSGNNQWMNVTADVTWNLGGASLFGAIYYSNTETKWSVESLVPPPGQRTVSGSMNMLGLLLQGSFYLSEKWELYGRYQYLDPISKPTLRPLSSSTVAPDGLASLSALTLGANWYLDGQDLKWTFEMGYAFNTVGPLSATPANGFRPTVSGYEFVLMTQLQLQF
ncbi:MAG: porin [Planctomycetota bacterium]|nr:porin [Planctomycetota bacterium]